MFSFRVGRSSLYRRALVSENNNLNDANYKKFLLALVFRLRESDRVVDEGAGFIPIEVAANEVELGSDISLVLTPMIAPEDFRPQPNTRPFARANTSKLNVSITITLTIIPCRQDRFLY